MFNLFKSKKRDSNVNKPIIADSLLNLVNQSEAVKNIYTVSIEDVFAVIKNRIENRLEKEAYPLDEIKDDCAIIHGKMVLNRYKRTANYVDMTRLAFRALYKKLQEEYISIGYKNVEELFSGKETVSFIKNDVYIKISINLYTHRNLSVELRIEMWSDDTDQLRQAYLGIVEMIDRIKYGE
nr:MAG TPA: hypothetical protein [Caudoviricetes sp.]